MDLWLWNTIDKSELSPHFKNLIMQTLKDYYELEKIPYIPVGICYFIVDRFKEIEKDLKDLHFEDEIYKVFIYHIFRKYPKKPNSLYKDLTLEIINNQDFRNKLKNIRTCTSGIIEFYIGVAKLIDELISLAKEHKSFLVLKKYLEIMEYCKNHGFDTETLNDIELLKDKLEKIYSADSSLRDPKSFILYLRNQQSLKKEEDYQPENPVFTQTGEANIHILQKCIHDFMLKFYKGHSFLVRPYNENINIYYLKELVVVAYKYDDDPNIVLRKGNLTLTWHDIEFWLILLDSDINYVDGANVNYFIEKEDGVETYRVESLTFKDPFYKNLGSNVIFVPEKYLEEGIYRSLTENGTIELDEKIIDNFNSWGIDFKNPTSKLMTSDFSFFFKDLSLIDEIELQTYSRYKHLLIIKSKQDKERKAYIKRKKTLSKKSPNKSEQESIIYQPNPNAAYRMNKKKRNYYSYQPWKPYKDD